MGDVKTIMISGRLPGLNDYINAERTNRYKAAKLKADVQARIAAAIYAGIGTWKTDRPVRMLYFWCEPDKRRDKDNISAYGRKVIQDALVTCGVIKNDNWKYIEGFHDIFQVDRENPHIKVMIREVGKDGPAVRERKNRRETE